MQTKRYGVRRYGGTTVNPSIDIYTAQEERFSGDQLMVRDLNVVLGYAITYYAHTRWRVAYCESCNGSHLDYAELCGKVIGFECWAEAFEALQDELRYQQIHQNDVRPAA